MQCISVWNPWAALIAWGIKRYETRDWAAWGSLIGQRIAIHAAKKPVDAALAGVPDAVVMEMEAAIELHGLALHSLPLGAIVCTAVLESAKQVHPGHAWARQPPDAYGDYSVGRYYWALTDVRRLEKPIPVRGRQGFFPVPPEALAAMRAQGVLT